MSAAGTRLYLLDIEGTVAPISLVTEQLFPYARAHFAEFLEENIADSGIRADLALLAEEKLAEAENGGSSFSFAGHPEPEAGSWRGEGAARVEEPLRHDSALGYLLWLMDQDRKSTALKSLQGKIWKAGFESGELKGTMFADVPRALERWAAGACVAIYSSGSVEAQQLLFRHSIYGDLTPHISGYFDTRTGPKTAAASYAAIAAAMGFAPAEILFLSDVVRELDPARKAGCQTCLVAREGNAPVNIANGDTHGHPRVESFDVL